MKNLSGWIFGAAVAGTISWFGFAQINFIVSKFYHPMSYYGSFGGVWLWAFAAFAGAVLIFQIAASWCWIDFRRTSQWMGTAVLALTVLTHALSIRIDTGHRETYVLDGVRHHVPWQYDPSTWNSEGGITFFRVKVSADGLAPRYPTRQTEYLSLTKAVAPNGAEATSDDGCEFKETDATCRARHNSFLYAVHGKAKDFPPNPEELLGPARALLDSFAKLPRG
ncbi:hypothetical protein [Leisingera sp.]|uniref:hypothetical protein n=1 Tax=Leisingera sp. TaxID=1879318 RepID=UPI002B272367|nr:hypothetical protein [Leisingera sp.]